ncbi:aminotransferase class I/II-fold pyridoxal phosphate-dependent enzyme, partial [Methylogaea oryzae]|uniref:aminotransferase class I/II-fold pyridoxal phosphate-dependent enzyme n=1 Tax=Methylogaea oryzae TaxID=1295382 RepID=UPI00278C41DF
MADLMNRVRPPFNVSSVALAAARAALEDEAHLRRSLELNAQGMQQLVAAFAERGLAYIPSVGNFVCVDMGRPAAPLYDALLRQASSCGRWAITACPTICASPWVRPSRTPFSCAPWTPSWRHDRTPLHRR